MASVERRRMSSNPSDFRSRRTLGEPDSGGPPDEFDLDPQFGEPKIPGKGFQMGSYVDCPDGTQFCPGPETGCTCYGATGVDTAQGPTCVRVCGETRGNTCQNVCVDTLRFHCTKLNTVRIVASCVNTCSLTC